MNISFHHSVGAVLKGEKTVTRRLWSPKTARCFRQGSWHDAWTACPWVRGAQRMALIQATADAYQEPLDAITQAEVAAEGFPEISVEQFVAFYCKTFKATPATKVWVARFCLVQPYIGRNAGRATPPDQQTGAIEGIEREGEEGRG